MVIPQIMAAHEVYMTKRQQEHMRERIALVPIHFVYSLSMYLLVAHLDIRLILTGVYMVHLILVAQNATLGPILLHTIQTLLHKKSHSGHAMKCPTAMHMPV